MLRNLSIFIFGLVVFASYGVNNPDKDSTPKPTMQTVKDLVGKLQEAIKTENSSQAKKDYQTLQECIEKLDEEAKKTVASPVAETGNEVCGDHYTAFVSLLWYALHPLRVEPIATKIREMQSKTGKREIQSKTGK